MLCMFVLPPTSLIKVVNSGQGRIKGGQRGQLPRALRSKGAPRDDIYLF